MADDKPSYKREHLVPLKQAEKRKLDVTFDAAGYIKTAQVPHPFLIDLLLERKIINGDHHFYGIQMITMRKVFLDPVKFKTAMFLVRRDDEGQAVDKPVPIDDTDYLKVLREMHLQKQKEIVMAVCMEEADTVRLYGQLERMEGTVHMAFGNLVEAINVLLERKSACAKSVNVPVS